MNLRPLEDLGIIVLLGDTPDELDISAPPTVTDDQWEAALDFIRRNKAAILKQARKARAELEAAPPQWPTPHKRPSHPAAVTPEMGRTWRAARQWIIPRLQELEAYGWTRATLFRAGKLRYPHGEWGAAWSSAWTRPGTRVGIGPGGEIVFDWTESNGRNIQQQARP